jgi:hypothetical protein
MRPPNPIVTDNPASTGCWPSGLPPAQGRPQLEHAVRPGGIVVGDVLLRDLPQMALPEDEEPIQALTADGPHPALGDRVRAGRLVGCPHDAHVLRPEHRVERGREVGIPVADPEGGTPVRVVEVPSQMAGLLGHPGGGRMLRAAGDEHPAGLGLDEEQPEQGLPPERLDREEIT